MNNNKTLRQGVLEMLCKNKLVRRYVARRSHFWFFLLFFGKYAEFETAPFQYEIFKLTEQTDWNLFCLVAFRGSAKSTLLTLSYVLWAALGIQAKKFVLIISQTQNQAEQNMTNIRSVLEHNEALKHTFGLSKEKTDTWGASTVVLTKLGVRITVASVSEAIRGIKHFQHRPDLVIVDDPEDLRSARTKEGRDKIYTWFKGEIMPIGSKETRFIVIGNVVHEQCLVMRLKQEITPSDTSTSIYREYPLIDASGTSMWPGKFPTLADIEAERKRIGNDKTWFREYLLQVIPDEDQIVKRDWIQYYDLLPESSAALPYRTSVIAVDPGTKNKEGTDPTAIVAAHLYGYGQNAKIYISPIYFNGRLDFLDIVKKIKEISEKLNPRQRARVIIESVQAQTWIFQELKSQGYPVSEFYPQKYGDKEQRVMNCLAPLVQNGQVIFHRGCGEIINQIVNLGLENHDDLCDAVVMLVIHLNEFMGHGNSSTRRRPISGGTPKMNPAVSHRIVFFGNIFKKKF